MVSSEGVSTTVGIAPRKQSLRSARRFMLGRLRLLVCYLR